MTATERPSRTTSAVYQVRLRDDLERADAHAYWSGPHADIVRRLPFVGEYNQHHFSNEDRGWWPNAGGGVTTAVDEQWHVDGLAELRFSASGSILRFPTRLRDVMLDEQNVFGHDLGHLAVPRGGRWWSEQLTDVGDRSALLIRRRPGARCGSLRAFVHDQLGPGLHAAGAQDVRTHVSAPLPGPGHFTPGVSHRNPLEHRHHAVVLFGADSRQQTDELLASAAVVAAVEQQHLTAAAIHAYTIGRTVPVVLHRRRTT